MTKLKEFISGFRGGTPINGDDNGNGNGNGEPGPPTEIIEPTQASPAVYRTWYYWCSGTGVRTCSWKWFISCPTGRQGSGPYKDAQEARKFIDAMIDWEQIECTPFPV